MPSLPALLVGFAFLLSACGPPAPEDFERLPLEAPRPQFTLEDLNPNSPSFGERLGPASFRGSVSAWYFGQST